MPLHHGSNVSQEHSPLLPRDFKGTRPLLYSLPTQAQGRSEAPSLFYLQDQSLSADSAALRQLHSEVTEQPLRQADRVPSEHGRPQLSSFFFFKIPANHQRPHGSIEEHWQLPYTEWNHLGQYCLLRWANVLHKLLHGRSQGAFSCRCWRPNMPSWCSTIQRQGHRAHSTHPTPTALSQQSCRVGLG